MKTFPEEAVHDIGVTLYQVQVGERPKNVKPLKGFAGADVLEIAERYDTNTYRLVSTVRFRRAIYVLHVFMKKSKHGIRTPVGELDLIKARLRDAQEDYAERYPNAEN